MSARRRFLASGILLAILGGQAAAIVLDRELWPFSPYPMFSRPRGPTVARYWLHGVRADGTEEPLRTRDAFRPFRLAQLEGALDRMDEAELREAAEDLLARHDRTIRALRIYRVTWKTDAPAGAEPSARELLAEARR